MGYTLKGNRYRARRVYIQQGKNQIWIYRRRIDGPLVEAYKNFTGNSQPFFKRSLKTRDRKEAEDLASVTDIEFQSLMQKLRHQAHLSPDMLRRAHLLLRVGGLLRSAKVTLDLEAVQKLRAHIDKELVIHREKLRSTEDIHAWIPVKYGKQHKKEMPLNEYCQHLQNAARILHVYERMFKEPGLDVSKELQETQRFLQEKQLSAGDIVLEQLQHYRQNTPQEIAGKVIAKGKAPLFSEALEHWKAKHNPREASYTEWKYAVRRFTELQGDLPVDAIEDQHIVAFRDAIMQIPSRLPTKHQALPMKKLLELAQKGEFRHKPPRSPNTVRKMIVGFSTILQVMMDDGYISRNPAKKKAPKSNDDGTKRPPYEFDELKRIFSSEYYRRDYWHSPAKDKPSRFWSPLIALYTGCRAGEIASLHISDVRQEKGIWYFSINSEGAKSIKTTSGIRDIPIHHALLKMGFIDYVKQRKGKGELLFPDVSIDRKKPSSYISNNFSRYVEKLGLKRDGKSFHSFRDNFSDACINSGLDDRATDRLLGHAMQGAKKHYGKGIWLSTAKELIDKLYDGELDLSHLYAVK